MAWPALSVAGPFGGVFALGRFRGGAKSRLAEADRAEPLRAKGEEARGRAKPILLRQAYGGQES